MFVIFWRLRLNVPRNASVTAHAFVRRRRRKASHASKVARQPVLSYHPREQRATRGTLRSRAIALISIARYRVDFNRAVIFEVNEYDRHGFQWVCRFIRIRASALSRARLFRRGRLGVAGDGRLREPDPVAVITSLIAVETALRLPGRPPRVRHYTLFYVRRTIQNSLAQKRVG